MKDCWDAKRGRGLPGCKVNANQRHEHQHPLQAELIPAAFGSSGHPGILSAGIAHGSTSISHAAHHRISCGADDHRLESRPMTPSLCQTCENMREVRTARSSFLLCHLSATNSHYRKYPPQPVERCDGYQ